MLSTTELRKKFLLAPGLKQPTNTGDQLLLLQFLLGLTPETALILDDLAIRRAYVLAHRFLAGEELARIDEVLLPALEVRGLPITKSCDLEFSPQEITPQYLGGISDEDLQKLHDQIHGEMKEPMEEMAKTEILSLEKMQQMEEDHRMVADMLSALRRFSEKIGR